MAEIRKQSGPGELYEGAYDVLSSAYQASEHWVQINTELVAINGSIYGIVISCILCLFVVVVLSHNWRLVVSMALTIVGIIITLLGLFEILGWRLGIVEAVSLSILVGNSLDYCIHLTEGYMSADSRHFGFLDRFKVRSDGIRRGLMCVCGGGGGRGDPRAPVATTSKFRFLGSPDPPRRCGSAHTHTVYDM